MTKRGKFWTVFGISLAIVGPIIGVALTLYNPFLAPRMVEYYSDDANYYRYEATVSSFSKKEGTAGIELSSVAYEDERAPTAEGNSRWAMVFSPNLDATWAAFRPEPGLRFEFIGNLRIFYDGGEGVIVSITVRGERILSFEDGKAALLEWARHVH